jgi:hypothetical protein
VRTKKEIKEIIPRILMISSFLKEETGRQKKINPG